MTFRVAPLTAATLVVLVVLDAWLWSLVVRNHDPTEQIADQKALWIPNLTDTAAGPAASKPISTYSETLARPIFFKARQPFVPPPPAPPPVPTVQSPPQPPAVVDPGLILAGVMIDGDAKRAYLFNKASSQGLWLSEGETIVGWQLRSIDTMSAKLQQGGRTILLQLYPTGPR